MAPERRLDAAAIAGAGAGGVPDSGNSTERLERPPVALNPWLLIAPALILVSVYLFLSHYYLNYFPFVDEPALFGGSNQGVARWFTRGFSDLLIVYPEWTVPYTDFMRPGSSFIFHVNQMLFGQRYALYFAGYYALQFAGVLLVILTGRHFALPARWLACLGLLAVINPAFMNEGALGTRMKEPDLWVGVLSLLSFYLVVRGRCWLALIPLTAGVFTKETALISPITACVSTYIATKRKFHSLVLLAPILAWSLVRQQFFSGSMSGLYAVPVGNARALLLLAVKGILQWPTGLPGHEAAKQLLADHSIRAHWPDVILFAANATLWASLFVIAWLVIKPHENNRRTFAADRPSILPLLIWTFGALGFGILGPRPEYGASIYPFEVLLFTVICYRAIDLRLRILAASALAILGAAFLWQAQFTLRHIDPDGSYSMKQLVAALQRYGGNGETIYVLNSANSYSAPSYIAKFSQIQSRLVILNEFEGCLRSADGITTITTKGGVAVIESNLPPCATVEFSGVHAGVLTSGLQGTLARGSFARYSFPDGRISSMAVRSGEPIIDFGKRVSVTLTPDASEKYIILYYDWRLGKFDCAGLACAVQALAEKKRPEPAADLSATPVVQMIRLYERRDSSKARTTKTPRQINSYANIGPRPNFMDTGARTSMTPLSSVAHRVGSPAWKRDSFAPEIL